MQLEFDLKGRGFSRAVNPAFSKRVSTGFEPSQWKISLVQPRGGVRMQPKS
jgi:hypothetical protein